MRGGRASQVANTELASTRANEDEDDVSRKRRAPSVDHRARALEHQEDEEHEHHELASARATTNARTRTRDEEGGMKGYELRKSKSFSPKMVTIKMKSSQNENDDSLLLSQKFSQNEPPRPPFIGK